jgi:hypothetical protein
MMHVRRRSSVVRVATECVFAVEVRAQVPLAPDEIWQVLADPWTWARWVTGTRRIRDADAGWPQPGSQLHHRFGPRLLQVRDHTTVLVAEAPFRLVVDAGAWPWGRVRAELRLTPNRGTTLVALREDATSGLVAALPRIAHPVQVYRNRRSLARMLDLARSRSAAPAP